MVRADFGALRVRLCELSPFASFHLGGSSADRPSPPAPRIESTLRSEAGGRDSIGYGLHLFAAVHDGHAERRLAPTHVQQLRRVGDRAVGNLPAFTRDETTYEVSIELTPPILKTHLALLKAKSGQPTPRLLELARGNQRLVLMTGRAGHLHYQLRELANAGCPISVAPPYPHELV